jgi:hypothetical protein
MMADGSGFRLVASPELLLHLRPTSSTTWKRRKRKEKEIKKNAIQWLARDTPIHVSGHVDPEAKQTFYPCASGGDSLKRPGTAGTAV